MDTNTASINFLIWQYLKEHQWNRSKHIFEQETQVYFDKLYFIHLVVIAEFEQAEEYLLSFTDQNSSDTLGILYCIRKNFFLWLLENKPSSALSYLQNQFKLFNSLTEINTLAQLKSFNQYPPASIYSSTEEYRKQAVSNELDRMIEEHSSMNRGLYLVPNETSLLQRILINNERNTLLSVKHFFSEIPMNTQEKLKVRVEPMNTKNDTMNGSGKLITSFDIWDMKDSHSEIVKELLLNNGNMLIFFINKQAILVNSKKKKISSAFSLDHSSINLLNAHYCTNGTNGFIIYNESVLEFYIIEDEKVDFLGSFSQNSFQDIGKATCCCIDEKQLYIITNEGVLVIYDFPTLSQAFVQKIGKQALHKLHVHGNKIYIIDENMNFNIIQIEENKEIHRFISKELNNGNVSEKMKCLIKYNDCDFIEDVDLCATDKGILIWSLYDLIEVNIETRDIFEYSIPNKIIYIKPNHNFIFCGLEGNNFIILKHFEKEICQDLSLRPTQGKVFTRYTLNNDNSTLVCGENGSIQILNQFRKYLPSNYEFLNEKTEIHEEENGKMDIEETVNVNEHKNMINQQNELRKKLCLIEKKIGLCQNIFEMKELTFQKEECQKRIEQLDVKLDELVEKHKRIENKKENIALENNKTKTLYRLAKVNENKSPIQFLMHSELNKGIFSIDQNGLLTFTLWPNQNINSIVPEVVQIRSFLLKPGCVISGSISDNSFYGLFGTGHELYLYHLKSKKNLMTIYSSKSSALDLVVCTDFCKTDNSIFCVGLSNGDVVLYNVEKTTVNKLYSHQCSVKKILLKSTYLLTLDVFNQGNYTPIANNQFGQSISIDYSSLNVINYDGSCSQPIILITTKNSVLIIEITESKILYQFNDLLPDECLIDSKFSHDDSFIIICSNTRLIFIKSKDFSVVKCIIYSEIFKTIRVTSSDVVSFAVSKKNPLQCSLGLMNGCIIFIEAQTPNLWN
ncbi:hypothetical protein ENUP19_0236G0003 [Entamoeba nuttalli]|uniref:TPR1-like CTLH-containing domain-containing protein n=2 Tax=Entamoeba nuttalli TaxID=412467 RepID=K2H015_ENTNP|nr:hypothetical protein ENU1_078960 [Entamoeba nuttalli P19]EKE40793.1 hypothetical protein ENU1_078960 [Entamoeba nuttalli P19]|eukprot:XP_008856862.1 hypothetical protein ENU1_078960 [Entamoeba nuttalli P19]